MTISWAQGAILSLIVIVAVMWLIALGEKFNRPRNRFDALAERKRNIAERGYRNSYNREWT